MFSASRSVSLSCSWPQPPSLGQFRPPLCPIPPIYLYAKLVSLVDPACISVPPPTMTVPTAASMTVFLTSSGQARPMSTV